MSVTLRLVLLVSVGLFLAGKAFAQDAEALGGPAGPDGLTQALHWTARAIEVMGIAIIVLGAIVSSLYFL